MNKLLLTLAAAAVSFAAQAEEVTFNLNNVADTDLTGGEWIEETLKADGSGIQAAKHYEPVGSLKIEGFTFTISYPEKGTKPAFYYSTSTTAADKAQKTLRAYKESALTFTAPEGMTMGTVTFDGSSMKVTKAATVNTGTLTSVSASQVVWNGQANSFTITLDGTMRIASVTVSTEGGSVTPATETIMLGQTDANGLEGWTIDNVDLDPELEYVWSWKNYNNDYYLNGSGYKGGALGAEALAISPVIDLGTEAEPVCQFEHAAKFQTTLKTLCGMLVREEGATEWTALTIPTWPEAGAWTWAESGEISLKAFAGKKIQVAFRYGSNAAGADTWEIRNLKFNVGSGETPVVPPTPAVETSNYTLATSLTEGTYLFAINGQAGANIAETLTYGRLTMTDKDVTVAGNMITAPTGYGIKIASTANGYTLTDCFGRYLGMDATHGTSFQIYTELNEGCYWTIELAADGTATIVNKLNPCTVSQTKGTNGDFYTNIAPANLSEVAQEDYNLPKLYLSDGSGVTDVTVDTDAPAAYYNLQGVQVQGELVPGLYIRRQGNQVTKFIAR